MGSGVAEVLSCNQELIAKRAGNPIEVKYILDLRNFPGDPNETKVVHDIEVILQDPEISIWMEEAAFLDQKTVDSWYPDKDFHTLYIAEIEKVLVK